MVPDLKGDPRKQKVRQNGFSRERRLIEEGRRDRTEPACFKITALMKKQQPLIKVNQPGPDKVFLSHKNLSRLREAFQRLNSFPLLAVRSRFIGQGFCGLVAHPKLLKAIKAFVSHLPRFFAEIQLKINVGQIQITKREMIRVAGGFTRSSCRV